MMASIAEIRRFVYHIEDIRKERLLQIKSALEDIQIQGGRNMDEQWLYDKIITELERRNQLTREES